MEVKICGVRDDVTARVAIEAGATAIGFVFADSPRRIEPAEAARIAASFPPAVAGVAVFRNAVAAEVLRVLEEFPADVVQVEDGSGAKTAVSRGVRLLEVLHDGPDLLEFSSAGRYGPVLLEAAGRGGRGIRPDWSRASRMARRRALVLAGGLTPANVTAAIRCVRPAAVDVSSGVESRPGIKDAGMIRAFITAALTAGSDITSSTAVQHPVFGATRLPG